MRVKSSLNGLIYAVGLLIITGRLTAGQYAVTSFTHWLKNGFFRPEEATRCTDIRKIWRGRADRKSDPSAKFFAHRCIKLGSEPTKSSKFGILPIRLILEGESIVRFLRNAQNLCASVGSFLFLIWSPSIRAFSQKFLIALGGETTDRIRKSSR